MTGGTDKLVVFTMDTDNETYEYGLPIGQVHEITRPGQTVKLPGVPAFVEGIMNLRGSIIPVVDIKKRFNLGSASVKDTTRIIVVQLNGKKCGVLVDDVVEIISLSAGDLDQPPALAGGINSQYIMGIGKFGDRLIIALDMVKILTE